MTSLTQTVQSANGALDDETEGRIVCKILGCDFRWAGWNGDTFQVSAHGVEKNPVCSSFSRPSLSVDVALAVVRKRWPHATIRLSYFSRCVASISIPTSGSPDIFFATRDDSLLPLAILAVALNSTGENDHG